MNFMRVIYSIGSTFAGTGIGNTAYRAVRGAYNGDCLKKVICLDYLRSEIPSEKIRSFWLIKLLVWYPLKALQRFVLPKFNPYSFLDPFYDFLSRTYVDDCDIFHGWRSHSKIAAKRAKKKGAKIIVVNASSHPLTQDKLLREEYNKFGIDFKPFTKKQLKRALEELNFADYVEVPSDFVYDSFIKNGFPKEKLIKIPFGINYENYSHKKDKKDKTFRAIFVGSANIRKGIHYLLQAWDELKLKDAELIVCGRVWEDAQKIVEKYKKNKTIKLLGFVDPLEWYEKSDVFVFPTIEEGSALVTYEAMASGLPLITTPNAGSIARDKKEALLFEKGNIEEFKQKLKYAYSNRKLIEKMGRAARKRVESFPWENYGKNVVKEYKRILNEKK